MTDKPTLASLQKQIEELKRRVDDLEGKNQSDLRARTQAEMRARGQIR
jgi:hypothetical protein